MAAPMLLELIEGTADILKDSSLDDVGVAASGTMALTGLPILAEPITVDTQTFTFVTLRAAAGQITLGTNVDACVTNIATAINTDLTGVTAIANTTSDTVVVTATGVGAKGNLIAFRESATNLTMDGNGYLAGVTGVWGNRITRTINNGLNLLAGSILLSPLMTDSTLTTSTTVSYVSLPTDFHRELFRVYNSTTGGEIKIYESLGTMLHDFTTIDAAGSVRCCTIKGNNLHYQYLPATAESLKIYYYKKPEQLVYMTDKVVCLPDTYAYDVLTSYAASQLYALIEDGIDGQKINTAYWNQQYALNLRNLKRFLGPADWSRDSFRA